MRKLLLSLGFSLSFIGLVFLAFNPRIVVKIQNIFSPNNDPVEIIEVEEEVDIIPEIKPENDPEPHESDADVEITPEKEASPSPEIETAEDITLPVSETAQKKTEGNIKQEPSTPPIIKKPIPDHDDTESVSSNDHVTGKTNPNPFVLPITAKPDENNLPVFAGFEHLSKEDVWAGDTPCGIDIFEAPLELPNLGPRRDGGFLKEPINTGDNRIISNQPTFLFQSHKGVTLQLVQPVIEYYTVSGRSFRDAHKSIFETRPLKSSSETKNPKAVTVANIYAPTNFSYMLLGSGDEYELVANKTTIVSAFLVTLPKWDNYSTASASDKAKWDASFCTSAHHELGHLRIRLDILAQTLDGYAYIPSDKPKDEIQRLANEYTRDINARIDARQNAYHVYNGGGLRRGMLELPYAELPFPWLEKPAE